MVVERYNYLNSSNSVTPNYMPNPICYRIRVYYPDAQHVIIVGEADNNYIYWLSVTKLKDAETNRMICDYISQLQPTVFGSIDQVLKSKTKYTYEMLETCYSVSLKSAKDIEKHYQIIKERCRFREANGKYLALMKYYLNILTALTSDPCHDYFEKRSLIELIRSESYLRVSDNPQVRELYNELDKCCANLYNAYMTETR